MYELFPIISHNIPNRDLLTRVENRFNDQTISQYDYTNDPAGRRIAMSTTGVAFTQPDTIAYTYNPRNEVTRATAQNDSLYQYHYTFDAIGNRQTATESAIPTTYTANPLNQYTAINGFEPQFDPDGNQTLIKTTTGLWHVTYNGENRPILWTQGTTRIEMAYDRLGRRIEYKETQGETLVKHLYYLYDRYLCLQEIDAPTGATLKEYTWDPTEKLATRPLQLHLPQGAPSGIYFYHFDGNKNVTALTTSTGLPAAHYEYSPFGALTHATGPLASINPYRFSSEHHDDKLGLVYYNYRHYNLQDGRWIQRDSAEEEAGPGLYVFSLNTVNLFDYLGLCPKGYYWNPVTNRCLPVPSYAEKCKKWVEEELKDMDWLSKLPDCPCNLEKNGDKFSTPSGNWYDPETKPTHHPGAEACIRSSNNHGGPGQQCCYDCNGKLITSGPGAGTPDRVAPEGWIDTIRHYFADVGMFDTCMAELGSTWLNEYLKVRPPNQGKNCD